MKEACPQPERCKNPFEVPYCLPPKLLRVYNQAVWRSGLALYSSLLTCSPASHSTLWKPETWQTGQRQQGKAGAGAVSGAAAAAAKTVFVVVVTTCCTSASTENGEEGTIAGARLLTMTEVHVRDVAEAT